MSAIEKKIDDLDETIRQIELRIVRQEIHIRCIEKDVERIIDRLDKDAERVINRLNDVRDLLRGEIKDLIRQK